MFTKEKIKVYVLREFIPDAQTEHLADDLDLVATGIIDSLGVLKLVSFIEMENGISIDPEDLDPDKLNTIDRMYQLINSKIKKQPNEREFKPNNLSL